MPEAPPILPASPATRWRRPRLVLSVRENPSAWRRAGVLTIAVLVAIVLSALVLIVAGVPGGDLADEFVVSMLSDPDSLRAILVQAAPLMLVGVGAALAFRVNFWNIGLEGQMIFGAIAATIVALHPFGPPQALLWLMAAAAGIGAAAWAVLPALLRLRLGINEIIATLLLNYVAQNFLLHLVYGPWKDPLDGFPHSPAFPADARLPGIGAGIGASLPIAVVAAVTAWWLTAGTRFGLYMRFVQANPRMAGALGVPLNKTVLTSVLLSAAAAGLGGFCIIAGEEGRLTQAFYVGYGFSGILIAFLARNSPLIAIPVALAFAWLVVTGQSLQVFYQIPFSMVQLIQAIIVICVAASEFAMRHRLRLVR
jgi:simple sugar transport system permease protein